MVLCRTFHTATEQGQGPTPIVPHCSGSGPGPCPSTGHSQCDYTITESCVLQLDSLFLYVEAPNCLTKSTLGKFFLAEFALVSNDNGIQ